MPKGGHGYWWKQPQNLLHAAKTSSKSRLRLQNSTQHCQRGVVQPQHVLIHTELLLIRIQSSITGEINVGGNKGQTQRSKTGVGSRRYRLTAPCLAPQGFRRAVVYHDIYYFCHVLGWEVHYNIGHFTLLNSTLCSTQDSWKSLQMI